MRPLTPSGHAELLRWPDSTSAPRDGAHIESCPEGNHSVLPQSRNPARQPHKGQRRVLTIRDQRPHAAARVAAWSGAPAAKPEHTPPRPHGARRHCAERKERGTAASSRAANTTFLNIPNPVRANTHKHTQTLTLLIRTRANRCAPKQRSKAARPLRTKPPRKAPALPQRAAVWGIKSQHVYHKMRTLL